MKCNQREGGCRCLGFNTEERRWKKLERMFRRRDVGWSREVKNEGASRQRGERGGRWKEGETCS